jgi:hypothetical protein
MRQLGRKRAGSGYYVGRFDNDENRPPMLVDNSGRSPPLQTVIYGDGEHGLDHRLISDSDIYSAAKLGGQREGKPAAAQLVEAERVKHEAVN